jgi:hypothetical protein
VRQAEDALPHADRELERHHLSTPRRGRRRSGDGPPLGSRREAQDAPPDPRMVIPCRNIAHQLTLNACEYTSAEGRDLLVPHGPHPSSRGLNNCRFGVRARCRAAVTAESFRPGTRSTPVPGQHYLAPRIPADPTSWGWPRVSP